jgi:hypothetical protein
MPRRTLTRWSKLLTFPKYWKGESAQVILDRIAASCVGSRATPICMRRVRQSNPTADGPAGFGRQINRDASDVFGQSALHGYCEPSGFAPGMAAAIVVGRYPGKIVLTAICFSPSHDWDLEVWVNARWEKRFP